ncbi:hypothetical protein EDD16DRAFT_1518459 [Pisolithus croceorrhizus]|nr:hypothetical protein EDD16DRAFT_1518459 [Pisolithus croceorrhizus]
MWTSEADSYKPLLITLPAMNFICAKSMFLENLRLLKLYSHCLWTTHEYQDIKDHAVAIVESLGQQVICSPAPIAIHGVQLSPSATPAIPQFSCVYHSKQLLIACLGPYKLVKANIGSKSSKGRKGNMNSSLATPDLLRSALLK